MVDLWIVVKVYSSSLLLLGGLLFGILGATTDLLLLEALPQRVLGILAIDALIVKLATRHLKFVEHLVHILRGELLTFDKSQQERFVSDQRLV